MALKILPPSMASKHHVARFKREAEITSKLHHAHIVRCVELGYDSNRKCHFCALEYIEGEDIGKRLNGSAAMTEKEVIDVARQIAEALDHAHESGLIHRDVKPENIMITPDGIAKLLDLGLARPEGDASTRFTQDGLFVGSVYYASPEQARGEADLDVRSDIYSLGATMYHMVAGYPPFQGMTSSQILKKHGCDTIPWPSQVNADVSEGLCRVISKMMAKSPVGRYPEPVELLRDLQALSKGDEPVIATVPTRMSTIALPRKRAKGATRHVHARSRPTGQKHRKVSDTSATSVGLPAWAPYAGGGAVALTVIGIGVLVALSGARAGRTETGDPKKPPLLTVTPVAVTPVVLSKDPKKPSAKKPVAKRPPRRQKSPAKKNGGKKVDDYFAKLRATSEARLKKMAAAKPVGQPVAPGYGYTKGLRAEYFASTDLRPASLKGRGVAESLNVSWEAAAAPKGIKSDSFSVRWTGDIYIPETGPYVFTLSYDDGMRLIIGGKTIHDRLLTGTPAVTSAEAKLDAGWQPIVVELREKAGNGQLTINWCRPGHTMVVLGVPSLRCRAGAKSLSDLPDALGLGGDTGAASKRFFDRFDSAMLKEDYRQARKVAAAAVGDSGYAPIRYVVEAAGLVAESLDGVGKAREAGARVSIGRQLTLKLKAGQMLATLRSVSAGGITVMAKFSINNTTRERVSTLKWAALHYEQNLEFARSGGWRSDPGVVAVAGYYSAIAGADEVAALKALSDTRVSRNPLVRILKKRLAK